MKKIKFKATQLPFATKVHGNSVESQNATTTQTKGVRGGGRLSGWPIISFIFMEIEAKKGKNKMP